MAGIHQSICLWGFQSALGISHYLIQSCSFLSGIAHIVAMGGSRPACPAGDFYLVFNDIEVQSVWGKGHFRELRGPAVLYWKSQKLDGGHSS